MSSSKKTLKEAMANAASALTLIPSELIDAEAARRRSSGAVASPIIVHLPHDSTEIPARFRDQFVLSDEELRAELIAMTDGHTAALFEGISPAGQVLRFPVSRLLVDVERFAEDALEIMASRGMGVVYTLTSQGRPLRRQLSTEERRQLLEEYYDVHHRRFTEMVRTVLQRCGTALIVDAHSFPSRPLPYELDQSSDRPEICIGSDGFHTPAAMGDSFLSAFAEEGFSVKLNAPFAGAIVPSAFFQSERAVRSVMIEINRGLYMDERTGERLPTFDAIAGRMRCCIVRALRSCGFA